MRLPCRGNDCNDTNTDIHPDRTEVLGDAVKTAVLPNIPVRRFGQPAEIAAAVAYLSSEEAGYVTAQTLVVDGGLAS